jgi:RNA polymerase subunit RPABC4/transcription elongation factor Spt4
MCKDSQLTRSWEGYIIVTDPNGEVGKAIGAPTPGKYALKIK